MASAAGVEMPDSIALTRRSMSARRGGAARAARRSMKVTAHYDGPAHAPVAKGQVVGKIIVTADGVDPVEFPLIAAQPVEKLGPFGRVAVAAAYLVWGKR